MRKVLAIMFMILCGFAFVGSGIVLLSGCSSSQSETGGVGSDPSENETIETPGDEEKNEDSTDNSNENQEDEEIEANADVDYTVQTLYRTSATSYTVKSSQGYFFAHWKDKNNNNVTWGHPTTFDKTVCSGHTMTGGGSGDYYVGHIIYLRHVWGIWGGNRMLYLIPATDNSDVVTCGVGKSVDNSSNRTKSLSNYYIYNYDNITTNVNTAKAGCNYHVTGTWYVYFRAIYTATYDANGGRGAPSTQEFYAGVGYTMSSAVPTRTGYTFTGWTRGSASSTATKYQPGHVFSDSWASSSDSWYANWTPNSYKLTYNTNNGGSIASTYVRYNDKYGKTNLYNPNTRGDLNGLSNYIFTINYTNSSSSVVYRNFFQPFNGTYSQNTKYTAIIEVLTYSGNPFYLRLTSPNEGGTNLDVATESTGCNINGTGRYTVSFTTRSAIGFPEYNLRSYIPVDPGKKAVATFRISIFTGDIYYNSFSYATQGNMPSTNLLPTPSKTGYTFGGWYKESNFVNKVTASTTVSTARDQTLYAKWEIKTYTLTLYYAGRGQTDYTDFTISSSRGTVRNSTVAYPSGSDKGYVDCTYSTSSVSVKISLTNDTNYDYYMRIGGTPTTSTYTKLYTTSSDSYTYTWTPTANAQINIYIYQRYTITYDKNGGTGTLPTSDTYKYKIHGTALTLGTNNLTKTSYTANGWNTNTTGTGTHYNSGGSYSTNANDTLYADWTPKTSTIKVQIKTSTNGSSYSNSATGGTVSVRYYYDNNNTPATKTASVTSASLTTVATNALVSQTVTFTPTAKSGYVFVGISTSTSAPNSTATTFTPSSSGATYTINVFFKVLSSNQLKYDSTEKYWYFEHGEYPQSYVGTSMNNTLNSASPTKSGEIKYNDGTTNQKIEVYTYNSKRYARLQATSTQTLKMSDGTSYTFTKNNWYWFEVEPIRWRVSDYGVSSTSYPSGWSTYGTYKTNFTVVSDRILTIGAVTTQSVKEGWAFKDSEMYSNISGLNKTASTTNFSASITNKQGSTNYTYYKFGSAGQQDKVVSVSVTEDGVRVASIEEIDDYLNDYSAKASDMVCFLLGCGTDDEVNYWTRNLGTSLSNGQIITSAGSPKSVWLDNVQGVRLALTMGNGSRI